MYLFRALMWPLFETLLLFYLVGTNSATVAGKNRATKLHISTTAKTGGDIANPPSPPPPPPQDKSNTDPFKPSIAVVVGVLTTMFSITFLLLLYAKHCKRGNGYSNNSRVRVPPSADRKNSGVDRTVIESLPIFRFASLRGAKNGLECAVCLNLFQPTEVLKLLPKCKHAFHVECVDTWLDAHSTCPLCRYRVDPEDILLLIDDAKILEQNQPIPPPPLESLRRVSGRHSSAGERGNNGGFLQIVLEKPGENHNAVENYDNLTTRRSLDGWYLKYHNNEAVAGGCFDRRKDGMLMTTDEERTSSDRRRLEHRIIVSGGGGGSGGPRFEHRWSDVQPLDLLYLRSEMIMSDSRRLWGTMASGSLPSVSHHQHQQPSHLQVPPVVQSGRSVINGRSVSEITGLSRWLSSNNYGGNQHRSQRRWERRGGRGRDEREAGLVSRWLAWVSQSPSSSSRLSQAH